MKKKVRKVCDCFSAQKVSWEIDQKNPDGLFLIIYPDLDTDI